MRELSTKILHYNNSYDSYEDILLKKGLYNFVTIKILILKPITIFQGTISESKINKCSLNRLF